ncbi:MAG TPA: MFS transporter [Stellaceae bacterium]|nr:MFS transporter [Stellaceae bacterium]
MHDSWQRLKQLILAPRQALLIVVFVVTTGMGMVWSILAVYATSLGASTAMVGLIFAMFGGSRLAVSFPAGVASEHFGRRPLMLTGLVFLGASSFVAMTVGSVPLLVLTLVFQGVGQAIYVTTAMAAIADLSTPEGRVRDMAAFQGASTVGISIGPGIGGLAAGAWGYGAPFLLQGGLSLVALILLLGIVKPDSGRSRPRPRAIGASLHLGPRLRAMAVLALLTYGVFFTRVGANWVLLPLIAREKLGMGLTGIGMVLTVGALANLLVLPAADRLAKRFGRLAIIIVSTGLMLAGLVALGDASGIVLAWLGAILLGIATGLAAPLLSAYAIDAAPEGGTGAALGMLRTVIDLAIITGPVVIGAIVDQLAMGYSTGLWFCGVLLGVATLIFWLSRRVSPPS